MPRRARAALRYVAEDAPSGYGDAADRLVRAVRVLGVATEYRGWSDTTNGAEPALVPYSRDPEPEWRAAPGAPTVAHLVPEYYALVRGVVPDGALVGHTVWETDRMPVHWLPLLDAIDLVMVPTRWNREVFEAGGVRTPIAVVPHVACDPVPGDGGAGLGLPDDVMVFYTISRWDERKAPFLTVRAFLDAFTADDPVVLVVKTGLWSEAPPPPAFRTGHRIEWTTAWQVAHLVRDYRNPARVVVASELWSPDQISGLHQRGDVFVALTRGEGWGLGVFDACAYGNPVVTTGWGGPLEYLDPEAAGLVDARIVPVHHHAHRSYGPDQSWAEPDLDHAVDRLRAVAADLSGSRARATPLRERVLEDYAPGRIAAEFLAVLGLTSP
jgi:glycosyltransferase involved in cell wall biosynthesis